MVLAKVDSYLSIDFYHSIIVYKYYIGDDDDELCMDNDDKVDKVVNSVSVTSNTCGQSAVESQGRY